MVQIPVCPKCTNAALTIVDIEVQGIELKGIQCNHCNEILWIYQDNSKEIEELKDKIEDLESRIDDIESRN